MQDAYRLSSTPTTLHVQIERLDEFDLSVFSVESGDLFLESIKQNRVQGFVEYDTKDWICLDYFLAHSHFSKLEAYCFLASLFQTLGQALKNQPVILDVQAIFLSPNGDNVRLCRAPLIFEAWMKRQADLEGFLNSLLHLFPSDSLDVLGLLWKGATGKERFENLRPTLERLYQESTKKSLFTRRKPIPPYCAKKPICIPEETASFHSSSRVGTSFVKEWEKRLPQSAQELFSQEDQASDPSFAFGFPTQESNLDSSLSNLEILEKAALFEAQEPNSSPLENWQEVQEQNTDLNSLDCLSQINLSIQEGSIPQLLDEQETTSFFSKQVSLESMPLSSQVIPNKTDRKREDSKKSKQKKASLPQESQFSLENATVILDQWIPPCFLDIQGRTYPLEDQEVFVGRKKGCQICLEDSSVSSMHAKLTRQEERWYIQDLKSTNFTWLNEKRVIRKMRLKEGMVIRFGQCEAIFHQPLSKT